MASEPLTFAGIFGEWLKRARSERGLTQGAFAKLASLTQGNVSDYERGQKTLTSEVIERVAKALDTDALGMIMAMATVGVELSRAPKETRSVETAIPPGEQHYNAPTDEDVKRVLEQRRGRPSAQKSSARAPRDAREKHGRAVRSPSSPEAHPKTPAK
jgi:transcriptional regulator with XRE-family HTH domain